MKVSPRPQAEQVSSRRVPPSCSDFPACFPETRNPGSALQPHSMAAWVQCGLPGPQLGRGHLPRRGDVPRPQDSSEVAFVCRKSSPVLQGCGPSSRPAPRAGQRLLVAPCGTFHVCVHPRSAIASPLNLVGSKFGLLAVTLAAWLSQCVFIFFLEALLEIPFLPERSESAVPWDSIRRTTSLLPAPRSEYVGAAAGSRAKLTFIRVYVGWGRGRRFWMILLSSNDEFAPWEEKGEMTGQEERTWGCRRGLATLDRDLVCQPP